MSAVTCADDKPDTPAVLTARIWSVPMLATSAVSRAFTCAEVNACTCEVDNACTCPEVRAVTCAAVKARTCEVLSDLS